MDSTSAPKRFQLADGLAIIGATAVTFALARYYWRSPRSLTPVFLNNVVRLNAGYPPLDFLGVELTISLALAAFSPILLWISIRQPRPPVASLVRQPGVWVCLVSTVVAWAFLGRHTVSSFLRGGDRFYTPPKIGTTIPMGYLDLFPLNTFPGLSVAVGPWMVATFLALLVLGKWRARDSWVEISGQLIGLMWVLLYLTKLRLPNLLFWMT